MARELLTSWGAYKMALERLLATAEAQLLIFEPDPARLGLESASRLEQFGRLLQGRRPDCLRIALPDAEAFKRDHPRLLHLLADYRHSMTVQQIPESLAHLRDAMVLADGRHGLIRFDRDQPRSKLLIDEAEEIRPYFRRFSEIWAECDSPLAITRLGL